MAEQRYRVIGASRVAGATRGQTVTLPPGTNVRALIKGGHIEPVADDPKPPAKKKTEAKS